MLNSRGGIKLVSSDKYATADAGFGDSMIEKPGEKRIDNFRPGRSRRHGQEEIRGVTTQVWPESEPAATTCLEHISSGEV